MKEFLLSELETPKCLTIQCKNVYGISSKKPLETAKSIKLVDLLSDIDSSGEKGTQIPHFPAKTRFYIDMKEFLVSELVTPKCLTIQCKNLCSICSKKPLETAKSFNW